MNKRPARLALLALAALAPACAAPRPAANAAPESNQRMTILPLALEPPPVYALIGYRDRLELSSQQVTALDSIATSVRTVNGPLIDTLQAKAITTNRTPGILQINPAERPILQQIRDNTRRALDQVAEVLTTEQETEVCELYEPDRPEPPARPRREDPEDAFRRGTAMRNDSTVTFRGFSVWPWCQRTGAAADSARAGNRN